MVSFPKLLYPLQTIPLLLQHKDFQQLQKALTTFLWRGRRPWVSLQKWYLPKREGRANLPKIRIYNLSCLLRGGVRLDWTRASGYSNYDLKSLMVAPCGLSALLHCRIRSLPPLLKCNLLIRDTLLGWREIRKKLGLSPLLFQHLPILRHPLLPQA